MKVVGETMNKEWLEELAKQAIDMSPLSNPQFPPSRYYRFLQLLAFYLKPNLSVELGVSGGGGSLHLALGNLGGTVVGVDIEWIDEAKRATIEAMTSNFFFWSGDSAEIAENVYDEYGPVGILFIDTIHTYERTWEEYNAWYPYLSNNAVVCFDDLFRSEMEGFWESLPEPKVRLDKLHDGAEFGGGFGVIWDIE